MAEDIIPTKICARCKTSYPYHQFHKDKQHKDGHYSLCKQCTAKKRQEMFDKINPHRKIRVEEKECRRCRTTKNKAEFNRHRGRTDGLNTECKSCRAVRDKERYIAIQNNPVSRKHCQTTQAKLARARYSTPEGRKKAKNYALKHKFGITLVEYERILKEQNGLCAICKQPAALQNPKNMRLHVDHDHSNGRVRGLLCLRCNTGLGMFNDSVEIVEAAFRYLHTYFLAANK